MHLKLVKIQGIQPGRHYVSVIRANMVEARRPITHNDWPRVTVLMNYKQCMLHWGLMTMAKRPDLFVDNFRCTFSYWAAQKKGLSATIVKQRKKLKYVKGISSVDQFSSVQPDTNVHIFSEESACRGQTAAASRS